ncbi:MAG: sulfite exporter TauE/SafE family protein [Clostridiales bacterium]|nr:sulfite exporter TauE/SafE family protein [Clostridiales bacterium]
MLHTLGFCLVVMLGFLIEATLGFGGTVVALPLCSMIVGIRVAVPAITAVVCLASLAIVIEDRQYIAYRPYGIMMLFLLLGMPLGMKIYSSFPERPLKIILGLFTVFVACKGLFYRQKAKEGAISPVYYLCLFLGGIIHGAFSCGGVLTVIYANRAVTEKRAYRVTLSAIWFSLNLVITIKNLITGAMGKEAIMLGCLSLPFVALAIVVGNVLIKRLRAESFVKWVYVMLFLSGALMFVQAL